MPLNLAELRVGQTVTVKFVGGESSFRRRLMELGLVPGTQVELLRVAPLGDPLEFRVRGANLSIRRAEASAVQVVSGSPSSAAHKAVVGAKPNLTPALRGALDRV